MITALQNLISGKGGKVLFSLLLLVVCVSFVLYLSQGSSVFDFLPNDSRYSEDYYGQDLNNPDVYTGLSLTHRVAADVGAVVVPTSKVMEAAEGRFYPEVPQRNRQQIMNQFMELRNRMSEEMSPEIMQLFSDQVRRTDFLMNNWNFLPRAQRARFIAQEGGDDREFSEGSFKAKMALEHLADEWDLLPHSAEDAGVDAAFVRYLAELDPRLADDNNRSLINQDGISIWLDVSWKAVVERLPIDGSRPLAADRSVMERLFDARQPAYRHAHVRLDAERTSTDALVEQVLNRLEP